jgi:hypothetical protein
MNYNEKTSIDNVLDVIFHVTNREALTGNFDLIDEMFDEDWWLKPELYIGLLAATLPMKSKLKNRTTFYKKTHDLLEPLGRKEELKGLE